MGQYHLPINVDRLEYLNPRAFDDGDKLTEFGLSAGGTMTALAALLATSSGRGFGDLHAFDGARPGVTGQSEWLSECGLSSELVAEYVLGRWAGDRIAIVGDYHEQDDLEHWGTGPDGEELAHGGPFGNSKYAWLDVSYLGVVAVGLEETLRDSARAIIHSTPPRVVPLVFEQLAGIELPTL